VIGCGIPGAKGCFGKSGGDFGNNLKSRYM
jgi:hypothetical protein